MLPTFDWVSPDLAHATALLLCICFIFLGIAPLELLDALVVIVDCCCEDTLCPVLTDNELIEMIFQGAGGDARSPNGGAVGQWPGCRGGGIVYAGEALGGELGGLESAAVS